MYHSHYIAQMIFMYARIKSAGPKVFIPVFPGTNCEYDSAKAFRRAGAEVETLVFKNQSESDILDSVDAFESEANQPGSDHYVPRWI